MAEKLTIENLNKENLLPRLWNKNCIWVRDDYLSGRGMFFYSDAELYWLLEHTAHLKEELRANGYVFNDFINEDAHNGH
jgi:hypothetical protein